MKQILLLIISSVLILPCTAFAEQTPFSETVIEIGRDSSGNGQEQEINITIGAEDTATEVEINTKPVPENSFREITVVRGDNLSKLARRHLGDGSRWRDLVEWNYERYPSLLKNPNLIYPGWKLKLTADSSENATVSNDNNDRNQNESVRNPAGDETMGQTLVTTIDDLENSNETNVSSSETNTESSGNLLDENTKVLHIGDSHTVGVYGKAMDGLMRETGAKTRTIGVSGSSPSWWLKGTTGKCGFYARDENGNVDSPKDWRTPRKTPKLPRLIKDFKPNVIVFSLGANLIHASPATIKRQVESVCEIAKQSGAKIVWIGPPNGRESKKPTSKQTRLYNALKAAAAPYGTFIDSRPCTEYPETGGDGAHYSGKEGTRIAKSWAKDVFNKLQKSKP